MTLDTTVAAKWPELAALLDPHQLTARFEEGDPFESDDSIEVELAGDEIGSIQVLDAQIYEYRDGKDRYVAGVWCDANMTTRAHGLPRTDARTACADLVGLAEKHNRIAAA